MNILELDSYNLADAVKFNDKLNPRIWQGDKMKPQVRAKLLQIAEDFKQSLGLSDLEVKDITVSGSNAGYTYTPNSDIDLHLVVDLPQADSSEVYRELFDAKKFQYNETHNISIGGYDVELYVENANQPPVSQGMYSVVKDDWLNIPKKRRATVDDNAVKSKYDVMKHRIEGAIASENFKRLSNTAAKIKKMRQAGLDKHGELGPENLAYKMLRTQGVIKALYDARTAAQDKKLSLKEQPKQRVTYGFKEDVGITPDGVSPSTKMFLSETDDEQTVSDFIKDTAEFLGIERMPDINLHSDADWGEQNQSFGRFDPETNELHVNLANRHIMDVLRTTAHELAHCKQHEVSELPFEAGETGSPWENEAHAVAGIIMRNYADKHPEMFQGVDLNENASGYIPKNKKEARDPRYSMAVTVDIKPGQVGKEANKLGLQTDSQGKPALLMKTANTLAESLSQELALFEEDLLEVKMTGKNLAKLASDIKGVKVGLEFEMIVPNVSDDDESDQEPDYDYDERVRDIDDAIGFFDDGDYNYGSVIRRTREEMESDFFAWQVEQMDEAWDRDGFEFFREYLDREEPFDPEDYQDRAEDEVKDLYPDLDPTSEEFEELKSQKLQEIAAEYYNETWQAQGRSYDRAREEFDDEQRDNFSEQDWLSEQGIRYASDVINEYTDLTWPHWTSSGGDAESDIQNVALDFMNAMGMDSVAYSSSYHGSYKKWVGDGWVLVGNNKPNDCFTIEPDGSLEADDTGESGLEFVSPPIPLEDIGTVMKNVQNWAGTYGAYTGLGNKTSIHTNISVPGYDIKNLDYLKAALLLGDEHVLREFDRIGNSYAKPAIEKVRDLVKSKPEKAKELLDKMKSQLNAEASKLIHSGVTDKFTSINTKDNRIEFRSPGGDYLSIIADNPQKMVDTINRMVVTMDAAMDPNKYKEEYQKKLYKLLTGQGGGREAKTGAKQEMKADDKDLLNIFSRYAAGELPRQALKSFVRQVQLQRKVAKGENTGKMWWNVKYAGQRMEVVATNKGDAKVVAVKEWGLTPAQAQLISAADITPLRPYEETPQKQGTTVAGRPNNPEGNWYLKDSDTDEIFYRFNAANYQDAHTVLQQWKQENPNSNINAVYGQGRAESAQQNQGNWGIWLGNADRFAREPGQIDNSVLRRFPSREAAEQFLAQTRAERPDMRTDIEVREIEPAAPIPGSTLDLQRQRAAQEPQGVDTRVDYEIYNRTTGAAIDTFQARNDDEAMVRLDDYRAHGDHGYSASVAEREYGVRRGPGVTYTNNLMPTGPGPWELASRSNNQVYFNPEHTNRAAAESEARAWIQQMGLDPAEFLVRTRVTAGNTDAAQGGIVDVAGEQPRASHTDSSWARSAPRTLTRPGQGQQVFTGEWKVVDANGQELYRFSGVGNSQADANRVAAEWAQRNMVRDEVNVVPVMGEA
jgi:hypothetical protein